MPFASFEFNDFNLTKWNFKILTSIPYYSRGISLAGKAIIISKNILKRSQETLYILLRNLFSVEELELVYLFILTFY